MALRVSGVSLIVKGFGSFVANLKTGQNVMSNFDTTMRNMQLRVRSLEKSYTTATERIKISSGNVVKAQKAIEKANLDYQNAEERLLKVQEKKVQNQHDLTIAQNNVTKAQINQLIATVNLTNAQLGLNIAEIKGEDTADKLAVAHQNLTDYQEKQNAVMGDFENILAQNIPAGQEFAGVLGSIGIKGSALIGILGAVAAAFVTVRATIWAVQKAIDALKWALDTVIAIAKGVAGVFIKAFQTVAGIVSWATRPLRTFLQHIIEIASGIALWRFIRNVGAAVRGLVEEVYDAVSAFQLLEIRLQALAARDYARAFGTDMKTAMEATSGAAAELFEWMRTLAVQTIFDTEEIANAFTMSVAMGMNVNTSKDLTDALVNFVSAMGLTDEHMWRIVYNLGQMIQRGKLTGEELRDLARNLFPLLEIFDRMGAKTGMTAEKLKELALEGGVPVNEFITEFIALVGEQYPDAAERAARTIAGVTANTRDFIKTFIGMDVFKPVLDRIASSLDDMLDKITENQQVLKTFRLFGQLLLRIFEILTPAVDNLVASLGDLWKSFAGGENVANRARAALSGITSWGRSLAVGFATAALIIRNKIQEIADRITRFAENNETTFQTLIRKAKEWGLEFIGNFASGIAGGLRLITSVIRSITTILRTWFAPGSPPLIAPDIDKWGAATMEEWIRGFTEADFTIFEDVTGLLESYFRSISDQFSKEALIPAIMEMRDAIGTALASFTSGASIQTSINIAMSGVSNLGAINDEFQLYLSTLLQIQQAEALVLRAHEAVLRAQADLNTAQAALDAFENSLTDVAAAEREVEEASRRVRDIQDQINAVTERYDQIISGLRAQLSQVTEEYDETVRLREIDEALANQRLTAEERERLMMERRAIEIEQQIRATEDQRDAEVGALEEQLTAAELLEQQAQERLEMIEAQAEAQRQLLELEIQAAEQRLRDAQLAEDQAELEVKRLEDTAEAYRKQIELVIEQNELFNEQKKILEEIAAEAEETADELLNLAPPQEAEEKWKDLDTIISGILAEAQAAADELATAGSEFATAWESGGITEAWSSLSDAAKTLKNNLSEVFGDGRNVEPSAPGAGNEGILSRILRAWDNFRDNILKIPEGETVFDWIARNLSENQGKIHEFALIIERASKILETAAKIFVVGIALIGGLANWLGEQTGIKQIVENGTSIFVSMVRIAAGILTMFNAIAPVMEFKAGNFSLLEWITKIADAFGYLAKLVGALTMPHLFILHGLANVMRSLADATEYLVDKLEQLNDVELEWLRNMIISILSPALLMMNTRQQGGPVRKGQPYMVGEERPELFVPNQSGFILPEVPAWFTQAPQMAAPMAWAGGGDTDNSVNLEITANYKNVQSEASIKYDVLAALAAIGR